MKKREEKRDSSDRRREPTRFWDVLGGAGRRMQNRRASEQPYFVDRFSVAEFALIILFLIFSLADGIITVCLLDVGSFKEANPVMDHLLGQGLQAFFLGKYLLTAAGLPLLLIFKNWYLFNTRLRVAHVLPIFVFLYATLLVYQSYLISLPPPLG